ncbi:MAG: ATP-dependent DNA helicase [Bacteroidales bacterium]
MINSRNFTPTPHQQSALNNLLQFIESGSGIFILKGHAGTGKTTLVNALTEYMIERDIPFELMASTGRAAKVLTHKTGLTTTTVHQGIYKLHLTEDNEDEQARKLFFVLRENVASERAIYIIDESSMLSNSQPASGFISFGAGKLIDDILKFAENRKVIFVGDPSQLPPFNSVFSAALSEEYLKKHYDKPVASANLTEIIRYRSDTGIYFNTLTLREKIEQKSFPLLSVKASGFDDVFVSPHEHIFVGSYVESILSKGLDNSIMVCFSNARSNDLNAKVRLALFGQRRSETLNIDELLMVVYNNYRYNLFNGDLLQVEGYSMITEYRAGLHFRDVNVYVDDYLGRRIVQVKIIDNLLTSSAINLSYQQDFELYRDFAIRMSNLGIRPKDPEYLDLMMTDPYLNALRVKYGYAVTCHKAQGGEWEDVFVLFEPCFFEYLEKESQYRWAYTAISRAEKRIHLLENRCIY